MDAQSPDHRLRKHPDYQRVYREAGRKQWGRQLAWFSVLRAPGSVAAQRSNTSGPRVGLTVPKALGKAVDRNRIKRRLRAIVQGALPVLHGLPVDIVLHPKRQVLVESFPALEREVRTIFRSVHARFTTAQGQLGNADTPSPGERSRRSGGAASAGGQRPRASMAPSPPPES